MPLPFAAARSVLVGVPLLVACSLTPVEPDPATTLEVSAPIGDPDIKATATWTVGGVTTATDSASIAVANGWITLTWRRGPANELRIVVPITAGSHQLVGDGTRLYEVSARLTRNGSASPLAGSVTTGRVYVRNDDNAQVLVVIEIGLGGSSLAGTGLVLGTVSACLDRHAVATCTDEPLNAP